MNNLDIDNRGISTHPTSGGFAYRFRRLVYHKYSRYLIAIFCLMFFMVQLMMVKFKLNKIHDFAHQISRVTMLDIGQGDSFVIDHYGGARLVIDVGKDSEIFLEQFLKHGCCIINHHQIHKTIDLLLLTHDDADHAGALLGIKNKITIKKIVQSPYSYSFIEKYMNQVSKSRRDLNSIAVSLSVHEGYTIQIGEDVFEILYPFTVSEKQSERPENDDSIVAKLILNNRSFLFTGDAGFETEKILIGSSTIKNKITNIDVLKVGHHGSKHSTDKSFLKIVSPIYALISAGLKNSYGHPHKSVLNRLKQAGIQERNIFRTDLCGPVTFTVYKTGAIGHPSCKSISTDK